MLTVFVFSLPVVDHAGALVRVAAEVGGQLPSTVGFAGSSDRTMLFLIQQRLLYVFVLLDSFVIMFVLLVVFVFFFVWIIRAVSSSG